jgi:hypothetical protein
MFGATERRMTPEMVDVAELAGDQERRLVLRVLRRNDAATSFSVTLRAPWLIASAEANTLVNGPPSMLFAEIAEYPLGWQDEKVWEDLEGHVRLTATCPRTGQVDLNVIITGPDYRDRAELTIPLQTAALASLSHRVAALFPQADG